MNFTYIVKKVKKYGFHGSLQRLFIINRHRKWSKKLQFLTYILFAKPMNHFHYRKLLQRQKAESPDTLYFFYDLEIEPITYDFIWALATAEARRKEHQLQKLKIIIVPGSFNGLREEMPEYQAIVDDAARQWRIDHILLASIMLLPQRPSFYFCTSRQEALLLIKRKAIKVYPNNYNVMCPTIHQIRDGLHKDLKVFSATPQARKYMLQWLQQHLDNRKLITITLRQYDYLKERNSNLSAWATFAKKLDPKEFLVTIIPDVGQSFCEKSECLRDFFHFDIICWNLALRTALYELAYLNLGVDNGPMGICYFNSQCRYISFKMTIPNTAASLENRYKDGYRINESPPFANRFQRWVWEEDNEDLISKEFNRMCEQLEAKNYEQNKIMA
jgi:hypothetical protein